MPTFILIKISKYNAINILNLNLGVLEPPVMSSREARVLQSCHCPITQIQEYLVTELQV